MHTFLRYYGVPILYINQVLVSSDVEESIILVTIVKRQKRNMFRSLMFEGLISADLCNLAIEIFFVLKY